MLVLGVQQNDSVIFFFQIFFHYRLLQDIQYPVIAQFPVLDSKFLLLQTLLSKTVFISFWYLS